MEKSKKGQLLIFTSNDLFTLRTLMDVKTREEDDFVITSRLRQHNPGFSIS